MNNLLKMKVGSKVPNPEKLFEGYEIQENHIIANVSIDKIESIMQHFIIMHKEEPLFFILEIPTHFKNETAPNQLHKDVYYIDGCTAEETFNILECYGNLLYNDGCVSFGFGCHYSNNEIIFGKYNVLTIYSSNIEQFYDFFEQHNIEQVNRLITAWDTFSYDNPGMSERYEENGKSIYDLPELLKDWGIYFAERREE
ncbi:MAG: hypothetical protein IKI11_06620 [Neisseriaceae bacterium]|nr:hypothetical protein [Neisseriaceae bacterium]